MAAELEGLFPRLGQRLRTATEHGERPAAELAREGVSPGLVAALEEETAEKVKPLPFHRKVLPRLFHAGEKARWSSTVRWNATAASSIRFWSRSALPRL